MLVSTSPEWAADTGHQAAWAAHWDLGAATVPTISHLKTLIGTGGLGEEDIPENHLDKQSHSLISPNDSSILIELDISTIFVSS